MRQVSWVDRKGRAIEQFGEPANLFGIRLSLDRKTAALNINSPLKGHGDVWFYDLSRHLITRFTSGASANQYPVWSPDSRTIVFRSNRTGRFNLFKKPTDGARPEELLYADDLLKTPTSFSPDGRYLAYWVTGDPKTVDDIWILPNPLANLQTGRPFPFMRTEFNEQWPEFSADGRWIAYQSNETLRNEIYVAPFPGPGEKRRVSVDGGYHPLWRSDGKELYYLSAQNRLMCAEVTASRSVFEVKGVQTLFEMPWELESFAASPDGQRFLVAAGAGDTDRVVTVIQNYTGGLRTADDGWAQTKKSVRQKHKHP